MNAGVQSALTTAIGDMSDGAFSLLAIVLPLAITVAITLILTRKGWGWFKSYSGLGGKRR